MQTSPMSLLRGSVLAAAILGAFAVAGCEKADEEPRERDPNATTMRITGPDGEEVVAEIVETKNGMRMRIEGNGEEQTIEMELPEGFQRPGAGTAPGDGSEQRKRWQESREDIRTSMRDNAARQDELNRKFDEDRDAFLKRFEQQQREFDRGFEEDGRRFDELRKRLSAAGAPAPGSSPAMTPMANDGGRQ